MAYEIGTAANSADLLARFRRFITGRAKIGSVTYTGTGDGTLTDILTVPGAPTETWTVKCTATSSVPYDATFSVSGSVSGAQASVTVTDDEVKQYNGTDIAFVLTDGATNFAVGDEFTFSATQTDLGTEKWAEMAYQPAAGGDLEELYLKGPGLAGTDEIYTQIQRVDDVGADIYDWRTAGAVTYDNGMAWQDQPGISPDSYMTLWNNSIPYWLIANGRRYIVVAKISTTWVAYYAGFILPYATPSEYPYPIFSGGNANGFDRWSTTSGDDRNFFTCGRAGYTSGSQALRHVDGMWLVGAEENDRYFNFQTWPHVGGFTDFVTDLDDGYALTPVILSTDRLGSVVFGEFDGAYHVPGYSQATGDTITIGTDTYLVVQDMFRTGNADYAAIKLE